MGECWWRDCEEVWGYDLREGGWVGEWFVWGEGIRVGMVVDG